MRLKPVPIRKKHGFLQIIQYFLRGLWYNRSGSLCVRTRREGDRIRLNGNSGSRTLKKLMIDRKIPRLRRDGLAVVADKYGVIAVQDIGVDHSRRPQGGPRMQIKIEGY